MSTIAFARATRMAEIDASLAQVIDDDQTPEEKASELAQKVAALVPAEVLVIWGVLLAATQPEDPAASLTADDLRTLKLAIPILAGTSLLVYVLSKITKWNWAKDPVRMLIPPIAFVAWTLLTGSDALSQWTTFSWATGAMMWLVGGVAAVLMLALTDFLTPKTKKDERLQAVRDRVEELAA
jgi:hypothetical protein